MEDDIYKGMFMPAGSVVLGNAWAMLHDERHYPEPERFNPERYLKDGQLDPGVRPPEAAAFGFGPRYDIQRYCSRNSLKAILQGVSGKTTCFANHVHKHCLDNLYV